MFKRHRLPQLSCVGVATYFLTICTFGRKRLFTEASLADMVAAIMLDQFRSSQYSLDAYASSRTTATS
jgi:hypothetical protein